MAAPRKGQRPGRQPVPAWWYADTAGVVNFSSATSEGADVLAAQVAVLVDASSATTEGADVLAGVVGVGVAVSSAAAEGADVLAAAVGVRVDVSGTATEGEDVLAAAVTISAAATADFSAALEESADVLQAQVSTTTVGGGYDDDKKRRRRYVVEKNGQTRVYTSAEAALDALDASAPESTPESAPEATATLVAVEPDSPVTGHYEALLALFAQREQEDIEMLLLTC